MLGSVTSRVVGWHPPGSRNLWVPRMARTHHLSLAKKTVFAALMLLMLGVAIELLGYAGGVAVVGRQFSLPRLQRQRDALVASAGRVTFKANTRWLQDEVLHPYLGFAPPGG